MFPDVTRRELIGASAAAVSTAATGCLGATGDGPWAIADTLEATSARQYSSPGCGCCSRYAAYLREYLGTGLEETAAEDLTAVKRRHGVPRDLRSCHTLVVDEYVVEGHVPASAVGRLLRDEPAIEGIALPGMPPGAPGMGGEKTGEYTVYVIGGGRTGDVYVEL